MNKRVMTYTEFLDNSPMLRFHWLFLIGVCLAQILDGLDFQVTSFALPGIIQEFKLNPAFAGTIASSGNLGFALGAILFAILGDRFGRRPIFQWLLLTYAFGTFLSAIAPTYETLLVARFIAGLGIGAEIPIAATMLAEYAPARLRHIFVPLVPFFFAAGWIVAAFAAIGLVPSFGWRSLYWVGVTPALMVVYVRFFLPESVRFLLIKGKVEEAGKIVKDLAIKAGMADVELVAPAMEQKQVKPSFGQQLALIKDYWVVVIVLALVYFTYSIQTLAVDAWLPTIFVREGFTLVTSFTYSLIIWSVTPFSHLVAAWMQQVMNRKWAMLVMSLLSAGLLITFGLALQNKWPIEVAIVAQFLHVLLGRGVIATVFTLCSELFPTPIRSLGAGAVNTIGRFGAVAGPVTIGLLLNAGTGISQILTTVAVPLVVMTVITLAVIRVDPRRKTLEEVAPVVM